MKFTPGIMALSKGVGTPVLIDVTGQTRFGDMSLGGGIGNAFDGVTNQAGANCANKQLTNTVSGYVGTRLASPKRITQAIVYGSNDGGFCVINPTITINIYGKLGSDPATSIDGTVLASVPTFTDTANESAGRAVTVTNTNTWDRVWVYIHQSTGTLRLCSIAELQIWGY